MIQNGQSSLTPQRPCLLSAFFMGSVLRPLWQTFHSRSNGIPLAFFNVGAEFGQLLFIAVVALAKSLRLPAYAGRHALLAATYAIGTMASFWFVERVASF
jgi:hypothetical protein